MTIEKVSAGICEIDPVKNDPEALDDDMLKRLYKPQAMHLYIQMYKTHPFRFQGTDGFLLAEALPQAPPMNAILRFAAVRF